VQVVTVQPQSVPVKQTWVATLTGDVNANISAQVSGYLQSQNYVNGAYVKAGAVLFQIDPRPFQAALAQAQGTLAQAQAQLTASELTAKRSAELYQKNVISQQQYDDQTQAYEANKANVQAAQAAVQQAQLNLTFTTITAPVEGVTSIATAQVGDLVGPSTGTLATVVRVDPIKVKWMVTEQDYVNFIQQFFHDPALSPINLGKRPDAPLVLTLADGTVYPEKGSLTSVNNVVGIETGSLTLEGEFPNPTKMLRPGQFGLVTATTHEEKGVMVIPQRAVIDLQGLTQLAVVGEGNKIDLRTVTLGQQMGSDVVVTQGLQAGDRVVVMGVQKAARQGEVVNPTPYTETPQEEASDPAATSATPTPTPKG
jgi:membrane fusion protein (multidrug efflux system)